MPYTFNPFTGALDFFADAEILIADPDNPRPGQIWLLQDPIYSDASPVGLLLSITGSNITGYSSAQLCIYNGTNILRVSVS